MNEYDCEKDLGKLYCRQWKECCEICYTNCENGELDCFKCDESIEIKKNNNSNIA